MGYVSMAMLSFIAFIILTGAFWGLIRGRNRALLRLGLVVLSVILAFAFKGVITNLLLDINIESIPIREHIAQTLVDAELPADVQEFAFTVIEILGSLIVFLLLFFAIKTLTWMILYPIGKIFVPKGINKHMIQGMLIGLAQGILIALVVCVPITGLINTANKLNNIKIDNEIVVEIPEEVGVDEYTNSFVSKTLLATGSWYYDALSSKTMQDGTVVSLDSVVNIAVTMVDVVDDATGVLENANKIGDTSMSTAEIATVLKDVGNSLVSMGVSFDTLSEDEKLLADKLLESAKALLTEEDKELTPEMKEIIDNLSISDFKLDAVGTSLVAMAEYIESVDNGTLSEFSLDDAKEIIDGLEENEFIIDLIADNAGENVILELREEDKTQFSTIINSTELSVEHKTKLKNMFGLS